MFSCSHFRNFLADRIEKQSATSKRGEEATYSEGSPMAKPRPMVPAKARPVNLVLRSPWSARENLPQDLGYLVNPGIVHEDKVITQVQEKCSKIRFLETGPTRRNLRTLLVPVRAATPRTEFQKIHQHMTKICHVLPKKLGITAEYQHAQWKHERQMC